MGFNDEIKRLDQRQLLYEKRMGEFTESVDRRRDLFERARTVSKICEIQGQEGVVLGKSENGNVTIARIFANFRENKKMDDETSLSTGLTIHISNAAGSEFVRLPWAHEIEGLAQHHANNGKRYKSPIGFASKALSLRVAKTKLNRFSDAMDMLETAGADPEMNFELSEAFGVLVACEELIPEVYSEEPES